MTDVIIIGAGPAGLSAAIYAKRAGLSVLVFDKGAAECQLTKAVEVENYLGIPSMSGVELYTRFADHAKQNGIQIVKRGVVRVEKEESLIKVYTKKDEYECKNVIIATGRSHRMLGVDGEERLAGAGVSYCATCDGYFFKDKTVCVVGGGDSALSQLVYLAGICKKVYLIHRREGFRAANYLVERAKRLDNVEFVLNATLSKINGESSVSSVIYARNGEDTEIACDGVFGAIGELPNMKFTVDGLDLTPAGYVVTDEYCKSNIDGIYAVGDIRDKEVCQIVTAVADGALAIAGIMKNGE
jgi:thioredoxin reductase (NADPH)